MPADTGVQAEYQVDNVVDNVGAWVVRFEGRYTLMFFLRPQVNLAITGGKTPSESGSTRDMVVTMFI